MTADDIPQQPQRQDSLLNQVLEVWLAALRLGCYDAADWIKDRLALEVGAPMEDGAR